MAGSPQAVASASTTPPANPGILRSKSNSDISITSSESKLSSITFAPLPCIEARKRRNDHIPIGIASRAEMLRKNRRQFGQSCAEGPVQQSQPDDDDIPLPDIGKLVKGLWKTVSRGQKNKNGREVSRPPNTATVIEGDTEEDQGEGSVWIEEVTWSPTSMDASSSTNFPRKDHPH